MGVERTISSLGLSVNAPSRIILFASLFSRAVHVWTQADKGTKTEEAQIGHRGLHRDPTIVNTSSQSIHKNASLMFIIPSTDSLHAQLLMRCRSSALILLAAFVRIKEHRKRLPINR